MYICIYMYIYIYIYVYTTRLCKPRCVYTHWCHWHQPASLKRVCSWREHLCRQKDAIPWMSTGRSNYDSFHWNCYTSKIHQIQKLKFLGTNSNLDLNVHRLHLCRQNVTIAWMPTGRSIDQSTDMGQIKIASQPVLNNIDFATFLHWITHFIYQSTDISQIKMARSWF